MPSTACCARTPRSAPTTRRSERMEPEGQGPVLPDLIRPGLRIVFCGTAPGTVSARRGAYYAHPQNRFWRVLHEVGLTPRLVAPEDYALCARVGSRPHRYRQACERHGQRIAARRSGRRGARRAHGEDRRRAAQISRLHQPRGGPRLSRPKRGLRRRSSAHRRNADLGAALALAGCAVELAAEQALVADARRGSCSFGQTVAVACRLPFLSTPRGGTSSGPGPSWASGFAARQTPLASSASCLRNSENWYGPFCQNRIDEKPNDRLP